MTQTFVLSSREIPEDIMTEKKTTANMAIQSRSLTEKNSLTLTRMKMRMTSLSWMRLLKTMTKSKKGERIHGRNN